MNVSKLRLLTFDVTGTLLKFRSAPGKQYGEIGAMYGILCDNDLLNQNFKAYWHKMNREHPNFGLNTGLGWESWWKQLIGGTFKDAKLNIDEKKLDAVASHLIEAYKTSTCWQPSYGALDLLSYLKHKGLTLGVISNFDPRLDVTLANTKLRHYFDFVLTSYEFGIEKPDPKIYSEAMRLSGLKDLKAEECLHIGDKAAFDYKGAADSGWGAALVQDKDGKNVQKKYGYVDSEHVFSSLYDFHRHLQGNSPNEVAVKSG